jgi:hypothetical protein
MKGGSMMRTKVESSAEIPDVIDRIYRLMHAAICNPTEFQVYYDEAASLAQDEASKYSERPRQLEMIMRAFDNCGLVNAA